MVSEYDSSLVLRSVKVLRIVRLLYISQSIFVYEKFVIRVFGQTLFKVRYFLLLCFFFAFMFMEMGEMLFAFAVRFREGVPDPNG